MYRRPKFLEVLLKIREEMARESDYDVDLYAEMIRSGARRGNGAEYDLSEPDRPPAASRPKARKNRRPGSNDVSSGE